MTAPASASRASVFAEPRTLFRALAIAEVGSWTLLIGGLVVRALTDWAPAVTIGGSIHGFVFLAYGATAVLLAVHQRWAPGPAILAVASAIVPYATVPVERWLARTGRLDGAWRRTETDDPRDRTWYDRAMRWLLRHPVLLGIGLVLLVAIIFVVLLTVGPPGGR